MRIVVLWRRDLVVVLVILGKILRRQCPVIARLNFRPVYRAWIAQYEGGLEAWMSCRQDMAEGSAGEISALARATPCDASPTRTRAIVCGKVAYFQT